MIYSAETILKTKDMNPMQQNCITIACKRYGIPERDIFSKKQTRPIAYARHYAMYLMRKELRMHFQQIADIFSKRHHSTVMHACKQVGYRIECNQLDL